MFGVGFIGVMVGWWCWLVMGLCICCLIWYCYGCCVEMRKVGFVFGFFMLVIFINGGNGCCSSGFVVSCGGCFSDCVVFYDGFG